MTSVDEKLEAARKKNNELEQLILSYSETNNVRIPKKTQKEIDFYNSFFQLYQTELQKYNKYYSSSSKDAYIITKQILNNQDSAILNAQKKIKVIKEYGRNYVAKHQRHLARAQSEYATFIQELKQKKKQLRQFKLQLYQLRDLQFFQFDYIFDLPQISNYLKYYFQSLKAIDERANETFSQQDQQIKELKRKLKNVQKMSDQEKSNETSQDLYLEKYKEAEAQIDQLLKQHAKKMKKLEDDHNNKIAQRIKRRELRNEEKRKENERLNKEYEDKQKKAQENHENAIKNADELKNYKKKQLKEMENLEKETIEATQSRSIKFNAKCNDILNNFDDFFNEINVKKETPQVNISPKKKKEQKHVMYVPNITFQIKHPQAINEFAAIKLEAFKYCSKEEFRFFLMSEENLLQQYKRAKIKRENDRVLYQEKRRKADIDLANQTKIYQMNQSRKNKY